MPRIHSNPVKKVAWVSYRLFSSQANLDKNVFFTKLEQRLSLKDKGREKLWISKDYFKKNYPKASTLNFVDSQKKLLFRGSEGLGELEFMLETNHLGKQLSKNLSKKNTLSLPQHIDSNNVQNYLSFTDCPKTALTYSTELNFVPGLGVVFITSSCYAVLFKT